MKKWFNPLQDHCLDRKSQPIMSKVCYFSLILMAASLLMNCKEEDAEKEIWEQELEQLRMVVASYQDIDNGIAAGYDNEFTGYRSQMGFHYLKASLLDDQFELEKPEVLMYAPDEQGNLKFVGVEYAVPIADMDNPPPAPEGFTANEDVWEINQEFSVWTLHVWVGIDNPHGVFASHNPDLP